MAFVVTVQLNSSFALYDVSHDIDGIYTAIKQRQVYYESYNFPDKIILIRSGGQWLSDFNPKEIGQQIGNKIDEHEQST